MYPPQKFCVPFQILCTPTHIQMGLPLYLANIFKAMKASSLELQAQLEKIVHPTISQSHGSPQAPSQKDRVGALAVHVPANRGGPALLILHPWII